jgi:hypothetical protein
MAASLAALEAKVNNPPALAVVEDDPAEAEHVVVPEPEPDPTPAPAPEPERGWLTTFIFGPK